MGKAFECDLCKSLTKLQYNDSISEKGKWFDSSVELGLRFSVLQKKGRGYAGSSSEWDSWGKHICKSCFTDLLMETMKGTGIVCFRKDELTSFFDTLKEDLSDMNPKSLKAWKKRLIHSITSLKQNLINIS